MSKKTQIGNINTIPTPNEIVYVHRSWAIGNLEGQILTFIDASFADPVQRKAIKNLISPVIWRWASDSDMSSYYELKEKSVGLTIPTNRN